MGNGYRRYWCTNDTWIDFHNECILGNRIFPHPDGNDVTSQRIGGSFKTEKDELEFYNKQNAGEGGKGYQTRGAEKIQPVGNPNRTKMFKF